LELGAADVVHGHSSHHPLAIEVWRGKAILYGCGDLVNDYEGIGGHGSLRCDAGCLYLLTLDEQGLLRRLEIEPLMLRRFRLEAADAAARRWLLSIFDAGGRALGSRARWMPEGRIELAWG
jgi:poly-gamma-glutamate synthesis protein (capsule biosynthesis protein)